MKKVINILLITKLKSYTNMLLQIGACARNFDETKSMSFLIEDHELLQKYNIISDKVNNGIKKDFDGKHVKNKKYLKTKIKS